MSDKIETAKSAALHAMIDAEILPAVPELDLSAFQTKISLSDLSALGVGFNPLICAIQNIASSAGTSGIYYVNTKGLHMFSTSEGFIGSLKDSAGCVGGGQARMTQLPCDPTMLFMAAALMNIEKKLDKIIETQNDILSFIEEKERASMQGNINVLSDVISNLKYNWDNTTYKTNKHILVQQIKKESEENIIFYRAQIAGSISKRSSIHSNQDVKNMLLTISKHFRDYQLALYLYSYSAFLETMLLGNFAEEYLNDTEKRISEYTLQYRELYTECYNLMETYSNSSIQRWVTSVASSALKFTGDKISKVPVLSRGQLDETLIKKGNDVDKWNQQHTVCAMNEFASDSKYITTPFAESIHAVNLLYNRPTAYLFDDKNLYIQQIDT